jgi:8-oxo-dGTP pyrophosphatase MutT (NUDIX family)
LKGFKELIKEEEETGVEHYNDSTIFFYPDFKGMSYGNIRFSNVQPNFKSFRDKEIYEPEVIPQSSGIIVQEPDGRIWIRRVANDFEGFIYSLAKGQLERGLSIQQNAIKETFEELGLLCDIKRWLTDFYGRYTISRFYLGKRIGGHPSDILGHRIQETDYIVLTDLKTAKELCNMERDKEILNLL